MGAWIEVKYNSRGAFGNSYGAGSTRMYEAEPALWITERMQGGFPIIITEITVLKGEIGQLTKVAD